MRQSYYYSLKINLKNIKLIIRKTSISPNSFFLPTPILIKSEKKIKNRLSHLITPSLHFRIITTQSNPFYYTISDFYTQKNFTKCCINSFKEK